MQKDDLITSKFRIQLPLAIQPASRSLAALHVTRARLLHHPGPETDVLRDTHCTKCGVFLLDGTGSVRLVRKARRTKGKKNAKSPGPRPYDRVLRRSCRMCGSVEDVPLEKTGRGLSVDNGNVDGPEATKLLIARTPSVATPPTGQTSATSSRPPSVAPNAVPPPPPPPSSKASTSAEKSPVPSQSRVNLDARAKSRPKKKSGLQDLLARNRERQEQEKKAGAGAGLAAFLQGL